jgi:hypothetical protein
MFLKKYSLDVAVLFPEKKCTCNSSGPAMNVTAHKPPTSSSHYLYAFYHEWTRKGKGNAKGTKMSKHKLKKGKSNVQPRTGLDGE